MAVVQLPSREVALVLFLKAPERGIDRDEFQRVTHFEALIEHPVGRCRTLLADPRHRLADGTHRRPNGTVAPRRIGAADGQHTGVEQVAPAAYPREPIRSQLPDRRRKLGLDAHRALSFKNHAQPIALPVASGKCCDARAWHYWSRGRAPRQYAPSGYRYLARDSGFIVML
jgi:hypothetical protein